MEALSTILMALFFGLSSPTQATNSPGLEAYAGKDLRKFDERALEEFRKKFEDLTGDKPEIKEWRSWEPWWVKPFTSGDAAWLLVEAYPGYAIPDVSGVQIHVFDKNWKRLAKHAFPTGYRRFLEAVDLNKDNPLKEDLLVATVRDQVRGALGKTRSGLPTSCANSMHFWETKS